MKIFADFESTGINPYIAEPITGFFLTEDGDQYDFKSKVDNWNVEAAKIHGITYDEMLSYPDKTEAFDSLLEWLPPKFELIVYANPRSEFGYLLYDTVLLKMSVMTHLGIERENALPFNMTSYSVHSLATECAKKNLFTPYVNPETNRKSYSQENVYRALFDNVYNSHVARDDVFAMRRIYTELMLRSEQGGKFADHNQMSLL